MLPLSMCWVISITLEGLVVVFDGGDVCLRLPEYRISEAVDPCEGYGWSNSFWRMVLHNRN